MLCGQALEHSPQSVHLPATWYALIIWNIFSSNSCAGDLFSTPEFGLSNTHFSHVQAGQASRQALQRIHFESSFCQNANLSSGVISSSFATSSKRFESSTSPVSPKSSSYATCFLLLQEAHFSKRTSLLATFAFSP